MKSNLRPVKTIHYFTQQLPNIDGPFDATLMSRPPLQVNLYTKTTAVPTSKIHVFSDFGGSKFQNVPGDHAAGPPSLFPFRDWPFAKTSTVSLGVLSSDSTCKEIFLL